MTRRIAVAPSTSWMTMRRCVTRYRYCWGCWVTTRLPSPARKPFVIITGHGDVASARAAFQSEAVDFLEKPFDEADLRAALEKGLAKELGRLERAAAANDEDSKLAKLTPREREVLVLVGKGLHAKEIARALAISPRTVEVHKASLMAKLGARNVAELVRYALTADKHS